MKNIVWSVKFIMFENTEKYRIPILFFLKIPIPTELPNMHTVRPLMFTYILDLRFEYCLYSYIEWKTQVINIGGVCVLYMLHNTYIMFVFLIAFTFVAIAN